MVELNYTVNVWLYHTSPVIKNHKSDVCSSRCRIFLEYTLLPVWLERFRDSQIFFFSSKCRNDSCAVCFVLKHLFHVFLSFCLVCHSIFHVKPNSKNMISSCSFEISFLFLFLKLIWCLFHYTGIKVILCQANALWLYCLPVGEMLFSVLYRGS